MQPSRVRSVLKCWELSLEHISMSCFLTCCHCKGSGVKWTQAFFGPCWRSSSLPSLFFSQLSFCVLSTKCGIHILSIAESVKEEAEKLSCLVTFALPLCRKGPWAVPSCRLPPGYTAPRLAALSAPPQEADQTPQSPNNKFQVSCSCDTFSQASASCVLRQHLAARSLNNPMAYVLRTESPICLTQCETGQRYQFDLALPVFALGSLPPKRHLWGSSQKQRCLTAF